MQTVHRIEHRESSGTPDLEISDSTLAELVGALELLPDDQIGRREASRLRLRSQVMMTPLAAPSSQRTRQVSIYDISRGGIAIIDEQQMQPGEQFSVLLPRLSAHPIEMICTVRHCRALGGAFVIGASYGSGRRDPVAGSVAATIRARGAAPA
jgi:hypothetical protein